MESSARMLCGFSRVGSVQSPLQMFSRWSVEPTGHGNDVEILDPQYGDRLQALPKQAQSFSNSARSIFAIG